MLELVKFLVAIQIKNTLAHDKTALHDLFEETVMGLEDSSLVWNHRNVLNEYEGIHRRLKNASWRPSRQRLRMPSGIRGHFDLE